MSIRIGDLPIIRDSEIQNFCLHGTVGAGKSEVTAMRSVFWHRIARRWLLCPGRAVQPGSVSGWRSWS